MQNEKKLESLLEKVIENSNSYEEFIKCLLDSYIYFLGETDQISSGEGKQIIEEKSHIQYFSWSFSDNNEFVPFFTSIEQMQKATPLSERYLSLQGLDFFKLTKGHRLILNPNSTLGWEFSPQSVENIIKIYVENHLIQGESNASDEVYLSHIIEYPKVAIIHLNEFLLSQNSVIAAYAVNIHKVSQVNDTIMLFGLVVEHDLGKNEIRTLLEKSYQILVRYIDNSQKLKFNALQKIRPIIFIYLCLMKLKIFIQKRYTQLSQS